MSNRWTSRLVLKASFGAATTFLAFGCTPVAATGGPIDAQRLSDGVYQGSAAHIDKAAVTVTVENRRLTNVVLDAFEASPIGEKARDVIPKRIVEKQSTKVDVVSGATEASNVIMNAAEAAVQKAYAKSTVAPP